MRPGAAHGHQSLPDLTDQVHGEARRSRGARIALAVGLAVYLGLYLTWCLRNHDNFGTYAFDLGIHDQAAWLLSRGHSPFVTMSGNPYFGDHLSWIMLAVCRFTGSSRVQSC